MEESGNLDFHSSGCSHNYKKKVPISKRIKTIHDLNIWVIWHKSLTSFRAQSVWEINQSKWQAEGWRWEKKTVFECTGEEEETRSPCPVLKETQEGQGDGNKQEKKCKGKQRELWQNFQPFNSDASFPTRAADHTERSTRAENNEEREDKIRKRRHSVVYFP